MSIGRPAAIKPCCIINTLAIASNAAAALGAWPVWLLIDENGGIDTSRSAKTVCIACHSIASPCGVEQACVLM